MRRYRHGPDGKPGDDTSGQRQRFYLSHPDSSYFSVGKIGDDQVQDLARRRGETVEALQRLLAPNL